MPRMITLFGDEEIIAPEALTAAPKVKASAKEKEDAGRAILPGWKPSKQYYTIGEVALLFNVRTSHIRFWTTEFDLKVRTTKKGDRLYSPAIIAQLRSVYHLVKERGFTIAGAKAKMTEGPIMSANTLDLKSALLKLRNQLLIIRNKL